ncbi:type III polyketide synthase [Bacillus sp. 1NLA3E]|uniref:type III polyketide synthase n=1 Tax=Bacillus sp. 1NLA3E TaxID=666686 RepID=UPI000247F4AA|nr:3-oxoacyl-[acyl-carrier-protein] synthase III C-terminal domain-containing protein [Bacillus sp. 1NLA3E]AGK54643.1 naringenin-chalcone synthase [Bacillus sp. 1NLA3E]
MPSIVSIGDAVPRNVIEQSQAIEFATELFSPSFKDIERLLAAFQNGQIKKRHLVKPLDWYKQGHSFAEKNAAYIEASITLGAEAITKCLTNTTFLQESVPYEDISAIFMISSTGVATPSIEARIMNYLPFLPHTKRIPIWGLGCAGGASGLSRAYEYCLAYPHEKVIVLSIELSSLTFQRNDFSKSNLIGTSLFADGAACALVCGDKTDLESIQKHKAAPNIIATQSTLKPQSLDVMGWEVRNEGFFVIFSKDIPTIVEGWLKPNVTEFLTKTGFEWREINHFIAHPGGKKVLEAYTKALEIPNTMTEVSLEILQNYGNMSSATIFYVLQRMMESADMGDIGLATALGPGFSSELLLMRWE